MERLESYRVDVILGGLTKISDLNRYEERLDLNMDLNNAPDGCIIFAFSEPENRHVPPISSQKNGICLTFSVCYDSNTVTHKIQIACDEDRQAIYYRLYWHTWNDAWVQL